MIKKIVFSLLLISNLSYSQSVQIDDTFNIGTGFNEIVNSISLSNNGKIIVGGKFDMYNDINANNVVRLNTDGTLDNTFNVGSGIPNSTNTFINSTYIQNDGKIIVAGAFTSFNGVSKKNIVRLNSDGSIDTDFNTPNFSGGTLNLGIIYDIKIVDDKILVAGHFSSPKNYLLMLNMDGSIVNSFTPVLPLPSNDTQNQIYKIDVQNDSKIIVYRADYINRYNIDSTIDDTFPILEASNTTSGLYPILTGKLQSDGKILIGGRFDTFNNQSANKIVRINNDGSFDNTFNTNLDLGSSGQINSITVTSDNKIIIGGSFGSIDGNPATKIARLLNDGTYDENFIVQGGAFGLVKETVIDDDSKILVGGTFIEINGTTSKNLGRIVVDESLNVIENVLNNNIKIYPNPTNDYLEIENPNSKLDSYKIFSLEGKIVDDKHIKSKKIKINLSNFDDGIYIIRLVSNNQIFNYKILKK